MKLKNFVALLLVVALATSCLKTDDQASGTGDALVITKKIGDNTVYGLSLYAYTFSSFKSVTVTSTDNSGKTYTLGANQGYKTNFYYETPDAEFSTTPPAATTFNFSAVFENGVTQTFQDVLSNKVLSVPNIQSIEYESIKNSITVKWAEVPLAQSYAINILDGQTVVFASAELAKSLKTYTISSAGTGWSSTNPPVSGKTYTVKLFAFLYEADANSYNVQAASVGEKTIVWGSTTNQ